MVTTCPWCRGTGKWPTEGDTCPHCGGDGEFALTDEDIIRLSNTQRMWIEYRIRNALLTEISDIKDKVNDIKEKVDEIKEVVDVL